MYTHPTMSCLAVLDLGCVCREARTTIMPTHMLSQFYMRLYVHCQLRLVARLEIAVGTIVPLVLSTQSRTRCDPIMPTILMPMVYIIAHNLATVKTNTVLTVLLSHHWRVYSRSLLRKMRVPQRLTIPMSARDILLAVRAKNNLFVMTVLA